MVEEELGFEGIHVNVYLAFVDDHRTAEQIKSHRPTNAYKTLFERIRLEREQADNQQTSSSDDSLLSNPSISSNNSLLFSRNSLEHSLFSTNPDSQTPNHQSQTSPPTTPSQGSNPMPLSPIHTDLRIPSLPATPVPDSQQSATDPIEKYILSLLEEQTLDRYLDRIRTAIDNKEAAEYFLEELLDEIKPRKPGNSNRNRNPRSGRNSNRYGRNAETAFQYKQAQELYAKDRTILLRHLGNGFIELFEIYIFY